MSRLVISSWNLSSTETTGTTSIKNILLFAYNSSWIPFILYSSQSSDIFKIITSGSTNSYFQCEFLGQFSNLNYYIGDNVSWKPFTGFLSEFILDNSVITIDTRYSPTIVCDYNQYFDAAIIACLACSASCGTWPWCAYGTSCSLCYSSTCSACNGYKYKDYTACNNGKTAQGVI